jgi:chromosome segregation ATPase
MTDESMGEWKLLKAWECRKCKLLIKDARKVYDHVCSEKEEDKLLALRKIIDDRDISLEEREKLIDGQKIKIGTLDRRIEGLEHFIKELNVAIDGYNDTAEVKDKIIEELNIAIEELNITIKELRETIDGCNNTTVEKDKIIEKQNIAIEDHKRTIYNQRATIEEQNATMENRKKNNGKVVEKVVYLEKGTSNIGSDNVISDINVDILQRDSRIKDSKDSGYREEIEVEIFERGKGKEKIIIKNGKVIKKPDDIIIIGKNTPDGFIVKGIYRN